MTKTVRIENACNSNFKIRVLIQDKVFEVGSDGKYIDTGEWETVKTCNLEYPTSMLHNEYITSTRRMVVEEYV